MNTRERGPLVLRIALAGVTARALFQIAAYFLHRLDVRRHHIEASLFIVAALALAALLIQRDPEETAPAIDGPSGWAVLGGTLLVALAVYWPALHIGFLSDDFVLADRAMRGEFVASGHEFVRPVPLVIWRLIFMSGAGATSVHVLNVLLHGVNAAFTARLARRLGARHVAALMAALLFLIWPTQVESVAWASGVFDVLMTTLVLALVNLYLDAVPDPSSSRIASMVLLALLALLTKETAAAIPALLLLVSAPRWLTRRPCRSEMTAFASVTLTCGLYMIWRVFLRLSAAGAPRPVLTRYAVKELLSRTFGTLSVPFTTEWSDGAPILGIAFAFVVVVFAVLPALTAGLRGPRRAVITTLIWPALAAAPALGYLFIGANLEGSRYLYLPMAGWAIFLAVTAESTAVLHRGLAPVVVCATALATASILHSRSLLADWSIAAVHRDAIVTAATRAVEQSSCRAGHFSGAPDSYKGAQLFKNGLDEAVRGTTTGRAADGQPCEFVWDGDGFVRR